MRRRWGAAAVAIVLVALGTSPANATAGDLGHDLAAPQCVAGTTSSNLPSSGTFGVVGVNNGVAWTANPCLVAQTTWAASLPQAAGLYANTANPAPSSSHFWPSSGSRDPALCADASSTTDPGCAYDYGWHTAGDALQQAAAQSAIDPLSVTWWLDVETANTWKGDGLSNAADLQGMVDRLRTAGVPDVGIYALASDWATVTASSSLGATAGYSRVTSNAYRAHWPFVPSYPMEDGPVWFAGAGTAADAQARCTGEGLTGGERLLSQYADGSYDGDYRCNDPDRTAPAAALTAPTSAVTTAPATGVAWTGSDAGSGLASYDVQARRSAYNAGFTAWSWAARRTQATTLRPTVPGHGTTSCWTARSRDAAGNVSGWTPQRCTTVPLDDRDLAASAGWVRTTGASGYFSRSFTGTTRRGATLTRTGVQTSHLVLLAWRCPTCGSLTVLLSGRTLTTVSLRSSTSGLAQITLPRFSLRSVTVTLRVASAGRLVRVDGLATSRV